MRRGDNAILLPSHYMADINGYNWLIGGEADRAFDPSRDFLVAHGAVRQRTLVVAEQHT